MKWTEQQQSAIETKGNNILVSAAAGSGKTAVLTERIKQLILNDGISVENMLIVTFSNAAAAEMKEKIIKSLTNALSEMSSVSPGTSATAAADDSASAKNDTAADKKTFLKQQIKKARISDISTFHKFSMGVIRRYFYLTEVDPDFGICDESRKQIMISEALDEIIEARFENDYEKFSEFLRMYSGVRSEDDVRNLILDVYTFIMSMPDPFEWLDSNISRLGADSGEFVKTPVYKAMLVNYRKELQKVLKISTSVCEELAELPGLSAKAEADHVNIAEAADIIENLLENPEAGLGTLAAAVDFKFETFRAKKEENEIYDDIKDMVGARRDRMKKILSTLKTELVSVSLEESVERMKNTLAPARYLQGLVTDFHAAFQQKKTAQKLLDFNDIEHVALEILRHSEVAAEYQKHFTYIFVDEYQDSSVLQETLISLISRGDNVYMVGDVKQSIYKFRLAEPEIFIEKYNSFKDDSGKGIRIDLNRNFRSKGNVINSINSIFGKIMNTDTCGIEYDEAAALKKGSDYEGELDKVTTLNLINDTLPDDISNVDTEIAELKKTELEARVVAELAAKRIGMQIFDQKKNCVREVGCGDIVVLLRGTRGVSDIYAKALKDAGMPAYIDAGEGFFETTEIEVFINLLRIIDNRHRDIPLISVLRSSVFGFTIDELIEIRLSCRDGSYSEAFVNYGITDGNSGENAENNAQIIDSPSPTAPLTKKVADTCAKLDRWRNDARYMPLENFLWQLMQETDYFDYVSALPGGLRRAANLRALIDKAVDFTSSQMKGLFGFITYIEAVSQNKVPIGQAMQTGNVSDMVRIMTIHKSKGLEFPVVILGGLGKQFNRDRNTGKVIMHKELGFALQYSEPDRKCYSKTLAHRMIARQKENERLAEEMRILYVAMTRAMDELVMVGTLKKLEEELEKYQMGVKGGADSANCYLDWIVPYLEGSGIELHTYSRESLSEDKAEAKGQVDLFAQDMKAGFPDFVDSENLMAQISQRFEFSYPYGADVFSKSKFSVSELNRALKTGSMDSKRKSAQHETAICDMVPEFMREEELITPARRGTLTHKVLELIPFEKPLSAEEVGDFADSLVAKNIMIKKEAEAVDCRKIAAFFASDIGKRACGAQWVKKEWAFTLKKDKNEIAAMAYGSGAGEALRQELPQELLIQGIIDCCFRDESGIVLVDYKTDFVDRKDREGSLERIRNEYRNQISLYREVIEKALGEAVSESVLFLLDSGDVLYL